MSPFILPLLPDEPMPEPSFELAVTVALPPMVIEPFFAIFRTIQSKEITMDDIGGIWNRPHLFIMI